MDLNKLNRKQLLKLFLTTQGDLKVPPHKRNNPNNKLTKICFLELIKRIPTSKTRGLHGVKR